MLQTIIREYERFIEKKNENIKQQAAGDFVGQKTQTYCPLCACCPHTERVLTVVLF